MIWRLLLAGRVRQKMRLFASTWTAVFLVATVAHATPPDLYGAGPRSAALGMTGTSYSSNYEAAFTNPAGLAQARHQALQIGAQIGFTDLVASSRRIANDSLRGMMFGFHIPLPFHDILQDRLVLGASIFTASEALIKSRIDYLEVEQFPVMDRNQSLAIQLGLGIDFHGILDGLRIGIGTGVLSNVGGGLLVRVDESSSFSALSETQLTALFAPTAGALYSNETWGVGFSYRHEIRANLNLLVRVRDLGVDVPPLALGGLMQFDPSTMSFEAFWKPLRNLRVIANATYQLWSAYPGPLGRTSASSNSPPAAGFSDTISPRVGLEYTLADGIASLQLRAGYAFVPSPAPAASMRNQTNGTQVVQPAIPVRILDNDRHVITAGFGTRMQIEGRYTILSDLYFQLHHMPARAHDIAPSWDPSGSNLVTSGNAVAFGWNLGFEY